MKNIITILVFGFIQFVFSQSPQEPIYLNFAETFNNYSSVQESVGNSCPLYKSNTTKDFPESFFYQIKNKNRISVTTKEGISCVGVTAVNGDAICGNTGFDFERSEIGLKDTRLAIHTTGNSYYKLKFYIDPTFRINNYNNEHTIFQIIPSNGGITNSDVKNILPQFLLQVMHEKSTATKAKLQFNYGLEFSAGNCYDGCSLGSNGKVDINNRFYRCGNNTHRKKIEYDINYGWNEVIFQIQWSEFQYGWMDIWVNDQLVNSNIGQNHTFVGNNIYNNNMIPYIDSNGQTSYQNSSKFRNSIKFGNYRYNSNATSTIFFEYFYADKDLININKDFNTYLINHGNGKVNMKENLFFDEVIGADDYLFLLQKNGVDQYIVSNSREFSFNNILNYDIDFYTDYNTNSRVRFDKGFNGKYSTARTISFEPDTKLTNQFCDNSNVDTNQILKVEKIKGADSYVLFIQEIGNPSNSFYHGVPSSGEISVQTLLNSNSKIYTNRNYYVNVRARFQQYGKEGNYNSNPCAIRFTSTGSTSKAGSISKSENVFYPNPFNDEINFTDISNVTDIKILNSRGMVLKKTNQKRIDLSNLNNGLYFLSFKRNGINEVHKIIKNKFY